MMPVPAKHSIATRAVHAMLAAAIALQLLTSLVLTRPRPGVPESWMQIVHDYVGLAALVFATAFLLIALARRAGTGFGALFPWTSTARLRALVEDIRQHLAALAQFRMLVHDDAGPFPSAVHGLGLMLMFGMALSGAIWFTAGLAGLQQTAAIREILGLHKLFGNLAWAYLIGHAALGVLHHYFGESRLDEMWSLRRYPNVPAE
jgi:hypothetical protein